MSEPKPYNPEEAAICERRGHTVINTLFEDMWDQCPHCGVWVRFHRTIETRLDAPPPEEKRMRD